MQSIRYVATLATAECDAELFLFLTSLRNLYPWPAGAIEVFIGCTSSLLITTCATSSCLSYNTFRYDKGIHWIPCLDHYGSINRSLMESQPGVWFATKHTDFMMEKVAIMKYALQVQLARHHLLLPQQEKEGTSTFDASSSPDIHVLFLDCDIVLTSELPLIPLNAKVGLSPHHIRQHDEQLFGIYNGGCVYVSDPLALHVWSAATLHSRYFDQSSLEVVASRYEGSKEVFRFGDEVNFGYWRMFQSEEGDATKIVRRFAITEDTKSNLVVTYDGTPLQSTHTHFLNVNLTGGSRTMPLFNELMLRWWGKCSQRNSHYAVLLRAIQQCRKF